MIWPRSASASLKRTSLANPRVSNFAQTRPDDRPKIFLTPVQIPQVSRRALEIGPESACLSLGTRKLRVSHELLDGVKRLLLLKEQG